MMEPGSFTSEPQYQRPDQRNSDIDYIRRPEPVQAPAVVPGVAPVVPPTPEYGWDPLFARRLFDKMGREYITCNRLDYYGNGIPLGSWCYAIAFIIYGFSDFTDAKFIESMTPFYGQSFYYLVELVNALLVSSNTAKDVLSLVPYI